MSNRTITLLRLPREGVTVTNPPCKVSERKVNGGGSKSTTPRVFLRDYRNRPRPLLTGTILGGSGKRDCLRVRGPRPVGVSRCVIGVESFPNPL